MRSVPLLHEDDFALLVSYSIGDREEITEAILGAFQSARIRIFDKPTTLVDWVNPDAIEEIHWSGDRPVYFSTRIWEHRVVVTGDEVRIYGAKGH